MEGKLRARYWDLWIFLPPGYGSLAGKQEKTLLRFMARHSKCVAGTERQPLWHKTWGKYLLFLSLLHGKWRKA